VYYLSKLSTNAQYYSKSHWLTFPNQLAFMQVSLLINSLISLSAQANAAAKAKGKGEKQSLSSYAQEKRKAKAKRFPKTCS
jgi:hypothetical protein